MPDLSEAHRHERWRWPYLLPLVLCMLLILLFYKGLAVNPARVPSPLIGKPVPQFSLPRLQDVGRPFEQSELQQQPSLLNVWATWCATCKQEHPVLLRIAATGELPVYGLLYKDEPNRALAWLDAVGNPYQANAVDAAGRTAIEWGVYGTPETFLIDAGGIIRHKHTGPISWRDWEETLLPLARALQATDAG